MSETEHLLPRADLELLLDRLSLEINELEATKARYAEMWTARRAQFDEIMEALMGMRRQIQDEKEEQDRREGMADEDGEEEGAINEGTEETSAAPSATDTPVAESATESTTGLAVENESKADTTKNDASDSTEGGTLFTITLSCAKG